MRPFVGALRYYGAIPGGLIFIWGCGQYARAKGYSPWFGLLGLLSIVGLILLVFFPDKHKDA
jgi:hypothetical protein